MDIKITTDKGMEIEIKGWDSSRPIEQIGQIIREVIQAAEGKNNE